MFLEQRGEGLSGRSPCPVCPCPFHAGASPPSTAGSGQGVGWGGLTTTHPLIPHRADQAMVVSGCRCLVQFPVQSPVWLPEALPGSQCHQTHMTCWRTPLGLMWGGLAHAPCALDEGLVVPQQQYLHPHRAKKRSVVVITLLRPLNEMLAVLLVSK